MEIKAKSVYNYEAVKAVLHLSLYKKANPKTQIALRLSVYAGSILLFLPAFILLEIGSGYLLLGLMLLVAFLDCYMFFILPKIQYKGLSKLQNIENEFTFSDDFIIISSKGEVYSGEERLEYSLLVKAYETSRYFFLYQTKNQVYIVDKQTIDREGANAIRQKLSENLGKMYNICRY